jgi:integrase
MKNKEKQRVETIRSVVASSLLPGADSLENPNRQLDGNAILVAAPLTAVGMEKSDMPRRRYQRGMVFSRGTKRKVWIAKFREDRVREDGTIQRIQRKLVLGTVKNMTKLQAIQAMQPYLDAVNLVAIVQPKKGKTLRTFVQEWESSVAPTLKPSTVRAAQSHLRTHILPAMGDAPLTAITTRNVQAFISSMSTNGLTRKSCENVLQTLSSLVKTAKAWRYIPEVFERAALSLPRAAEKTEERFFTAEQVKLIIAASEEPYSTLWAVLALTGCRAGEILALRRGDLDFDKRVIRIRRTLDGATRLTHAPKSKSSSADLPMPTALEKRLRTFLAEHWRANESDLLFCNRKGKPMQRDKAAFVLQETLSQLGIEKAAFHAFRHMAASELLESGAAPSVVQRQMRHSDARITLQSYGHIIGDAQRTAMNSLSERVL